MRNEYLVRFADGHRHTIAYQEQSNNETVYVDRYTGRVIPSAMLVHRLDRPEWSGEACATSTAGPSSLVRVAVLLRMAAARALRRAGTALHVPQRGATALAGGLNS
jgi:hypothetical protein